VSFVANRGRSGDNTAVRFPARPSQPYSLVRTIAGVPALLVLLASIAIVGACARPHYVVAPTQDSPTQSMPASSPSRHVVLVSIDGLRPDAIATYAAPTLHQLMREGSYTLKASAIMPSEAPPQTGERVPVRAPPR
jgi:hypothetical protein